MDNNQLQNHLFFHLYSSMFIHIHLCLSIFIYVYSGHVKSAYQVSLMAHIARCFHRTQKTKSNDRNSG